MACSSSSSFSFLLPRNFHLRPQLSQFPPPLSSFLRSRFRLSIQASAALTLDLSVRISPSKLGEIKRKSNIAVVRLGPGIGGDAYITTPTPSLVGVFPSNVDFHIVVTNTETTLNNSAVQNDILACPICFETLMRRGPPGLNLEAIYRSGFKCQTCNKSYSSKNVYLDLTVTAGSEEYSENKPTSTELFRSPVVSFLYERGWRQNFNRSGFPGPDEEFKMAQEYFKPAEGGLLVDVSCGSGLFSRKFAKCGTYSGVIALDFSENMLRQCYDFTKKEGPTLSNNLALVRADVARLPFPSASIDAVHAGAALHCWPSPSNAIADITRVLRSGGVFVGTTFLRYTSSTPPLLRPLRERILQTYSYLIEEEIEDLCKSCGLVDYSSKVQQSFIMFSARKP